MYKPTSLTFNLKNFLKKFSYAWGKTTISNAGISRRVFRKPPGAPGRVRVVNGQVGQVRLG